jgi:hypothetical protein
MVLNTKYNMDVYENDWGHYIDLESIKNHDTNLDINNEDKIRKKYNVKRYNYYDLYNEYCEEVCNEYYYYTKNTIKDDDYFIDISYTDESNYAYDNIRDKNVSSFIVRVSSTTIITAVITYVVFFML